MKKPKKLDFIQKAVKQGNSLVVRIPRTITKKLGIKENTIVYTEIINIEKTEFPEWTLKIYKEAFNNKYSFSEIKKYLMFLGIETFTKKSTIKEKGYAEFKKDFNKKKKEIKTKLLKEMKKIKR